MKISSTINQVLFKKGVSDSQRNQGDEPGFSSVLEDEISKVNREIKEAEKLSLDLASGKQVDLPTVMMAINKADISFRLFVQVRNKALSAYEEIMRLQF